LHSNRSAAFIELGQPTKALEDADACVAIDPRWPKGYSRRGNALHALRRYREAQQAYEHALRLDPENQAVRTSLRGCIQAMIEAGAHQSF